MAAQGFALALAILAAAAASVRAQDSVPLWPTNVTSINVCTSEYTPSECCSNRGPRHCSAASRVVLASGQCHNESCAFDASPFHSAREVVYCVDREPSGYSGYEIELFRKVALILGWSESQMQWSCLAWDDMIAGLANGTCDIAVAGVQINAAILEAGLVLTRPTYRCETAGPRRRPPVAGRRRLPHGANAVLQ
jgi:ABC-type amino acid transport substrate-binding protein